MTKISELHQNWLKSPGYKKFFDSTDGEFALARQLIEARIKRGMSQSELAVKMGTSQSTIVRLESGKTLPSMRTLCKFAKATNSELQIKFKLS